MAVDLKPAQVWTLLLLLLGAGTAVAPLASADRRTDQPKGETTTVTTSGTTGQATGGAATVGGRADLEFAQGLGDRYERSVTVAPGTGQACAVLDAAVFAHAAASLDDLELLANGRGSLGEDHGRDARVADWGADMGADLGGHHELAFATTLSEPVGFETEVAHVLNRHVDERGHLDFDLEMPLRPYTSVNLQLGRQDYVATATVSGLGRPGQRPVPLGSFALFDLTSDHLFHNTEIPLEESSFPYLHIELAFEPVKVPSEGPSEGPRERVLNQSDGRGSAAMPSLRAMTIRASVPPSRQAQSLYTTTQSTARLMRRGSQRVASFRLPLHVPVERVVIVLAPEDRREFSRTVEITAQADQDSSGVVPAAIEQLSGTIFRVRRRMAHGELSAEVLKIPVAIGSNMQEPATLQVAIDEPPRGVLEDEAEGGRGERVDRPGDAGHVTRNEGVDAASLGIASVELQMRRRAICFNPPHDAGHGLTLAYGASHPELNHRHAGDVDEPLQLAATHREATLGPEIDLDSVAVKGGGPSGSSSATEATSAWTLKRLGREDLRRWAGLAPGAVSVLLLLTLVAIALTRGMRR